MGVCVIVGCFSEEKLVFVKENGVDELINYSSDDLQIQLCVLINGKGVDVVYDFVGGQLFDVCICNIVLVGRLLVVGFVGGDIFKFLVNLVLVKEYVVVGVFFGVFI